MKERLKKAVDLMKLAEELSQLRYKIEGANGHPEYRRLVRQIALAEIAARAGEGSKALEVMEGLEKDELPAPIAGAAGLFRLMLEEVRRKREGP